CSDRELDRVRSGTRAVTVGRRRAGVERHRHRTASKRVELIVTLAMTARSSVWPSSLPYALSKFRIEFVRARFDSRSGLGQIASVMKAFRSMDLDLMPRVERAALTSVHIWLVGGAKERDM